ncbi:ornithine--oxo-acid transaminase [Kribbia dieselivorans]|uniref:ornithine--oxo-acid transaminase n=1 Tax=Kribbia dieselivorans TaxID=331526 RepID=UPI0009FB45E4|nr:ornithine--oxo-acid transaminase [Kribbia dieselivorans]
MNSLFAGQAGTTQDEILLESHYSAHNYAPLPVVISSAEGCWVTDVDGRRYLDCLAGYSALSFGHRHPALIAAAREQLDKVTLTSRAFHSDQLGPFSRDLAALAGMEVVLPMNTGAEAVETGVKLARRWGYRVKGIEPGKATIIVAANNFHGRTTTIIGFSTDPTTQDGFGPFTPGFRAVPFGDLDALTAAIDETTAAVLIEPIQGEAGVVVPPSGYLAGVRAACTRENVLFIADEVQSGLGRTGATFACELEDVHPDVYLLGKALGGGIVPVSAVVSTWPIMEVFDPGSHGSTFGGNPLACAVGHAVVKLLETGEYQRHAATLGRTWLDQLQGLIGGAVTGVRARGLWAGIDLDPTIISGRAACERLAERGVLAKETHESTLRLGPPLTITADELTWATDQLRAVLS